MLDPAPDHKALDQIMRDAADLFPQLRGVRPIERWAGMIDVTPDEIPVLGPVDGLPGLLVATGFSGHGFGIGPAAGYVMAQLAIGEQPTVDLHPFRYGRFRERRDPLSRALSRRPGGVRAARGSRLSPSGAGEACGTEPIRKALRAPAGRRLPLRARLLA